jgi:hypothetical protein
MDFGIYLLMNEPLNLALSPSDGREKHFLNLTDALGKRR